MRKLMRKSLLRRMTEEDSPLADPPPYPDSNAAPNDDARVGPDGGSPPRTPRWVKAFGIIAIVVVLLVVIILVTSLGGPHGPGRHIVTPTPTIEVQQP